MDDNLTFKALNDKELKLVIGIRTDFLINNKLTTKVFTKYSKGSPQWFIPKKIIKSTGKRDKNKTLIFEMDIVKAKDRTSYFIVKWSDDKAAFYLESIVSTCISPITDAIEKIGNKLENPKLLNKKEACTYKDCTCGLNLKNALNDAKRFAKAGIDIK